MPWNTVGVLNADPYKKTRNGFFIDARFWGGRIAGSAGQNDIIAMAPSSAPLGTGHGSFDFLGAASTPNDSNTYRTTLINLVVI
jgi:hypothetical protein